jgi:tetratricopeptide (TPR) repeat protein
MLPVVPKYLRLLLGAPPFFIDYTYMRGGYSLVSAEVLVGLGLLLALVAAAVLAWRGRQTALFGFGLLWMGLFLLPVSNLLPMMQYMAERFLYLPLVGWLIVLVAGGLALRRSRVPSLVSVLVVLLWAGVAWNRSWIWQDDLTLFVRSAQEGPHTPRVQDNAVAALLKLPNVQAVFSYDRKANLLSFRNTADAAARESALRTFETAQQIFPDDPVVLSCLGISLATCGHPAKALPYLERASALSPGNVAYALNCARAGLDATEFSIARSALDKASSLAPDDVAVLQLRFKYCWLRENYPAAREAILRLNQLAPSDETARRLAAVEEKLRATNSASARPSGG